MRFACLLFAYKDPKQLRRTIDALGDMDFYIHVDLKTNITPFKNAIKNNRITWIKDRTFVCWGGYSQFEALKKLMKSVVESKKHYDRIIVMTALDYPVFQSRTLEQFFYVDSNKNFCTTMNISRSGNSKELSKIEKYWIYDIKIKNNTLMRVIRKVINCFTKILYKSYLLRKKPTLLVGNDKWDVYFGSESCCLTYECFIYIYNTIRKKSEIEKYFKYSFAPIELVSATIISNSPYKNTIEIIDPKDYTGLQSVSSLYYMKYDEEGGTGMKILDETDFDDIIKSGKPFCRKVASDISKVLENKIDKSQATIAFRRRKL